MVVLVGFGIFLLLLGNFVPMTETPVGVVEVAMQGRSGAVLVQPMRQSVRPFTEIRQTGIVKQMFDFSCGSAALATLLNHSLGERFSERQVIDGLLQYGDTAAIMQRQAFSLLDMKRFVSALGYEAGGFQGEVGDLETLEYPCIVPIRNSGFQHFVVLKAVAGGRAFMADPFQGNLVMGLDAFEAMWADRMLFLVFPKGDQGLSSPRLTEVDLRFVDGEFARNIIDAYVPPFTTAGFHSVLETLGTHQFYKPK